MDEDRGAPLPAFGRWLSQERELRGLGQAEVARATKLTPALVDALESGDPDRMPPRAYAVGYLRSYAAAVGLDADDVVLRYEEAAGAPEGRARAAARGARTRATVAVAIAVAVIAVGLLVIFAR
jgi:cytoskeletal protein RodZ